MWYVIHKSSRMPAHVSYNGPACGPAGVVGGLVYGDYDQAIEDAKKLSDVNPVGFMVSELPD